MVKAVVTRTQKAHVVFDRCGSLMWSPPLRLGSTTSDHTARARGLRLPREPWRCSHWRVALKKRIGILGNSIHIILSFSNPGYIGISGNGREVQGIWGWRLLGARIRVLCGEGYCFCLSIWYERGLSGVCPLSSSKARSKPNRVTHVSVCRQTVAAVQV